MTNKQGLSDQDAFSKANNKVKFLSHPDEDTSEKANELSRSQSKEAWELLKTIVELSPNDEKLLGFIGAGPFEDWITENSYKIHKIEIEEYLKSDPKWQVVIGTSWSNPGPLQKLVNKVYKTK